MEGGVQIGSTEMRGEQMGAMGEHMGAMEKQFVKEDKRGAMGEQMGAMEKQYVKEDKRGAMEKHMGAMEKQFMKEDKRGAMEEVVQQQICAMGEELVQHEYVRVHELDVAFSMEIVPDDVSLVHPDAETQDPFAMTEESLTWSSGCVEREIKWREAAHDLVLSGTWKKKNRTINVGVQVGGEDVHVPKHPVVRAEDVLDAKKNKWDDIDDPKKNPIIGEMLHLHSSEYFNMDGSIKAPKNDFIE